MAIKKPEKRPFAPWLKEHRAFSKHQKKHSAIADLLLTPLIDMFVILVVFLIMNFSAGFELPMTSGDIKLPKAAATAELERAPIIQISASTIAIEGVKVGESDEILKDPDLRISPLTDKLQEMRKVDEMMHPGLPFKGQIIVNCDKNIDFKLVRKVMFAAADAGYTAFNYAVLVSGAKAEGADEKPAG